MLDDAKTNIRTVLPDPIMNVPCNRSLGLVLAGDDGLHQFRYAMFGRDNSPGAFGHTGAHGQVAWADPATGISFAFVKNGLQMDMMADAVDILPLSDLAVRAVTRHARLTQRSSRRCTRTTMPPNNRPAYLAIGTCPRRRSYSARACASPSTSYARASRWNCTAASASGDTSGCTSFDRARNARVISSRLAVGFTPKSA